MELLEKIKLIAQQSDFKTICLSHLRLKERNISNLILPLSVGT